MYNPSLDDVKTIYQQLADHTLPHCKNKCKIPLSCCSKEYCQLTKEYAKEEFNIELLETEHETLPFMGENGCIADPFLRPWCTYHVCCINSAGVDHTDLQWTETYFRLREKAEETLYFYRRMHN